MEGGRNGGRERVKEGRRREGVRKGGMEKKREKDREKRVCSDVPGTVSGSLHLRLQLINVLIVLTEGSADGVLWGGEGVVWGCEGWR